MDFIPHYHSEHHWQSGLAYYGHSTTTTRIGFACFGGGAEPKLDTSRDPTTTLPWGRTSIATSGVPLHVPALSPLWLLGFDNLTCRNPEPGETGCARKVLYVP